LDTFTRQKRSWIMSRVHSANTKPEIVVRSILHRLGYRFRLHKKELPGAPDIVLPKYNTVIFVHGCFWHRHLNCSHATLPASNQEYWLTKFKRTVERDKKNRRRLRELGWKVIVVWECELRNPEAVAETLKKRIVSP
jgi:DNA mismatch endonuclease (patch repair protein)